jgi:hypothetical protein
MNAESNLPGGLSPTSFWTDVGWIFHDYYFLGFYLKTNELY